MIYICCHIYCSLMFLLGMPGYPGLPGHQGLPGIQGETGEHGMRGKHTQEEEDRSTSDIFRLSGS